MAKTPAITKLAEAPATPPLTPHRTRLPRAVWLLLIPAALIAWVTGFHFAYRNRVLQGVSADGVYVGGLTTAEATQRLAVATTAYLTTPITVNYAQTHLAVTPAQLGTVYSAPLAASQAINYGRTGSLWRRIDQQIRALFDRPTAVSSYSLNPAQLGAALQPIAAALAVPVQNAAFSASGNTATVVAAQTGTRLDAGQLIMALASRLAAQSAAPVAAVTQQVMPSISTASLQAVAGQAATYLSAPVTLNLSVGGAQTISPTQIASWLAASRPLDHSATAEAQLQQIYSYAQPPQPVNVGLNASALQQYVAGLAAKVDAAPVNAQLSLGSGNQVSVFQPSANGYQLDQTEATNVILAAIKATGSGRTVAVNVQTIAPAVSEANLNSLGINQLISEGETTFPEGPAVRLQNIRAGVARFNDVLLAPGQIFDFNNILGPVDAAHGFDEALVIAGNTVTNAYGGGLCQVSTTMYRTALLAGLPIVSRTNHSFVVSYYTGFRTTQLFGPNAGQTYGSNTPGLDATIYLPDPDLRFQNDTGHYILIQSQLGYGYLKFDFYGTATKYGVIRGPYFTSSGQNTEYDTTQTVFYRDIYNMAGQLEHTDTITSNYLPAIQFGE